MIRPRSGFVPYAYDPDLDSKDEVDDEDPADKGGYGGEDEGSGSVFSVRGLLNLGVLLLLVCALLALFVAYPVVTFFRTNARNLLIDGNTRVNSTGQVAQPVAE